jgi:gliding motility-associated-like protein
MPTNAFQMQQPPFSQVTFLWPTYNYSDPINGNPKMEIDTFTGLLTVTPTRAGQYVVGIKVKEFRNGVLIGETLRDYQFNVQACVIDVVAGYFVPKIVCGLTYQFQNQSAGGQRYSWNFGIDSLTNDTSNSGSPQYTFPKAGAYKVKLYAYKNTCVDSFEALVNVVDPILPKLPNDTILCKGSKIIVRSSTKGDSYRWSTGSYDDSLVITQPGQYWVRQYIKSCYWQDTIEIGSDTDRVQVVGDTVFCTYDPIVQNLRASWPIGSSAWSKGLLEWSTNQTSPSIRVTQPGFYVLKGTTENKCISFDTGFIYLFPPVEVDIRDTLYCRESSLELDSKNPSPAITEWSTGAKGRYWTTNGIGSYWVRVTIGLCFDQDTFQLGYHPIEFQLGPDLRFCSGIDTLLTINQKGLSNVVWNNEILGPDFRLTKPGKIKAEWSNSQGCYEADSLMVSLFPLPGLNLGSDTVLCLSENPTLDAGPGMAVYRWNTGESTQRIVAYDSGQYVVWVKDQEGCWNSDTVWIDKKKDLYPSVIYMPSAFTPDGNGLNDFYPMNQYKVKGSLYNVKLYNRWGEKLAELESPDFNWDGRINGEEAPAGVYVYLATWIGCDNERRTLMGNFTLLR